jgi:hypothetical protein
MRLQSARTLAWLLLLCGWIGLGSVVQTLASSVLAGFAVMALWLLATGTCAEALRRSRFSAGAIRVALPCAGIAVTAALATASHGSSDARLVALVLAWAVAIALASVAVRACRNGTNPPHGSPIASGAAAAALAWTMVGDPTDLGVLEVRLAGAALVACIALALLWPRLVPSPAGGCRAALFDCALPAWPRLNDQPSRKWPLMFAALVMLPMMCGLPLMMSLCRGEAFGSRAVLGLHLAAMFLPALATLRWPLPSRFTARACAGLLLVGGMAPFIVGGAIGWSTLVIAQGGAWSLAWAVRSRPGTGRTAERGPLLQAPLTGAAVSALMVLGFGFALDLGGLTALVSWHLALGLGAICAPALVVPLMRPAGSAR